MQYNKKRILIKKIIYTIIYGIMGVSFAQTIILGSYIFNNQFKSNSIVKNIIYSSVPSFYYRCTNSILSYKGNYKKSNKIDIVLSNHIFMYDCLIPISIIRQIDDRDIYLVFDQKQLLWPGYGLIYSNTPDIKLNNGIDKDRIHILDTINNKLADIKSGIIIIFPEGDYFTNKNYLKSKAFSQKNNLHQFNNILYPKMKGLYIICDELKKVNKLGNVIDMTIVLENFKSKECNAKTSLIQEIGCTKVIVTSYKSNYNLNTYDEFKEYFLKIWKKKDAIYDTVLTLDNFTKVNSRLSKFNLNIIIFVVFIFTILVIFTLGIYLPLSLFASYYIILKSYKFNFKDIKNLMKNVIKGN